MAGFRGSSGVSGFRVLGLGFGGLVLALVGLDVFSPRSMQQDVRNSRFAALFQCLRYT